jgi:hypothetical protein
MLDLATFKLNLQSDLEKFDVMLTSDMSIDAARRLWLSNSIWKKFLDGKAIDADSECLDLFLESNTKCKEFALSPKTTFEDLVVGEVKTSFDNYFFSGPDRNFDSRCLFENLEIGPGASIGVKSYNFYTKMFDSTLSCTSMELYRLYRSSISEHPTWLRAETARRQRHGVSVVGGSRFSFVPKTSEISRGICTEPVLNMYFQKGLGSVFESILKRKYRIDLSSQPELNRRLAQEGSSTGSFGTIDLSSASDSISLNLLKEILPRYVYQWVCLFRSPVTIFPDGNQVELDMVSTMGNAFTFPLMSLLFATIVRACYRTLGIKLEYQTEGPRNFAVFGDDIIVRKDAYNFVVRALELFGFSVNESKSFNVGSFRESCGGDYFNGHDIRGVYCKSLSTSADVYSLTNRLVRWSAKSGILLPKAISQLRKSAEFLQVPYQAGDSEGFKTPYPPIAARRDKNTGATIYRALCKLSTSLRVPLDESSAWYYPSTHKRKKLTANYVADGVILALLGGYLRNGRIGLRSSEHERFKIRRRMTSSWGHIPAVDLVSLGNDWEIIAELSLFE